MNTVLCRLWPEFPRVLLITYLGYAFHPLDCLWVFNGVITGLHPASHHIGFIFPHKQMPVLLIEADFIIHVSVNTEFNIDPNTCKMSHSSSVPPPLILAVDYPGLCQQ